MFWISIGLLRNLLAFSYQELDIQTLSFLRFLYGRFRDQVRQLLWLFFWLTSAENSSLKIYRDQNDNCDIYEPKINGFRNLTFRFNLIIIHKILF